MSYNTGRSAGITRGPAYYGSRVREQNMLSLAAMVMDEPVRRKPPGIDEGYFERIAEGDASAFAALYREAAPAVFAYALSVLKNRESAEDITQETFLKVRGAAHLYKKQGKPLAFLFTIARNLCLMQLRKARCVIPAEDPETLSAPEIWPMADAEDRLVLEEAFRAMTPDRAEEIWNRPYREASGDEWYLDGSASAFRRRSRTAAETGPDGPLQAFCAPVMRMTTMMRMTTRRTMTTTMMTATMMTMKTTDVS